MSESSRRSDSSERRANPLHSLVRKYDAKTSKYEKENPPPLFFQRELDPVTRKPLNRTLLGVGRAQDRRDRRRRQRENHATTGVTTTPKAARKERNRRRSKAARIARRALRKS